MSGSNIQEEVPEEEIDEDYEDEKEEDSGMGAMIAGGAGLLVVVAAVVVILVCACGCCDSPEKPAPAPTPEKPVTGPTTPPGGEPPQVEPAQPQTSKESFSNSPKSASAKTSNAFVRSKRASGNNPKTMAGAFVGALVALFGAMYLIRPGMMPGGAGVGGAAGPMNSPMFMGVTPAHMVIGLGALCCCATSGLTAKKAMGDDGNEAGEGEAEKQAPEAAEEAK